MLLNKCDLLDQKLKAGEQFSKFVRSFKEANDFKHVSECMPYPLGVSEESYDIDLPWSLSQTSKASL